MQRSSRATAARNRATLRTKPTTTRTPIASRTKSNRVQNPNTRGRRNSRNPKSRRVGHFEKYARDDGAPALSVELEPAGLHRQDSISACSEASLEFIRLSNLETDDDTNIVTLNLMDYFLFCPENWLPELSYCKLHAACFLFASRLTGKSNSVDQVADALGPGSKFVQLVGSPLAADEDSAAEVQYMISVAAEDVKDGYALLYLRKEMLAHLLGQYSVGLEALPLPENVIEQEGAVAAGDDASENFDLFETEE